MAADGRRNCNVNGNSLSRISRILNDETAQITCNCERFVRTYRVQVAVAYRGGRSSGFAIAVSKLLQPPLPYPCSFAVQNP